MKNNYVIVGSGLAAVGAAKALINKGYKPIILDSAETLPGALKFIKNKLKNSKFKYWEEINTKNKNFKSTENFFSIPKKLVFESDFFIGSSSDQFKLTSQDKMVPPFSRALGGLSNGWGAATLPISLYDFYNWPISHKKLLNNFKEVIADIQLSGANDSLSEEFPLLKDKIDRIRLSPQDNWLINSLKNARPVLKGKYVFGQSRLLVNSNLEADERCRYCSLCKNGCDYGLVYKSSDSIMKWINEDKITYVPGITVQSYNENEYGDVIVKYEDKDFNTEEISCKKLFIACGALPSSKIFLQSNIKKNLNLKLKTRGGYVLPVWRFKSFRYKKNFNNEPGVFIEFRNKSLQNWVHIQVSSYNELLEKRLMNSFLGKPIVNIFTKFILRHLVILLVNFHSSNSGYYKISIDSKNDITKSAYSKSKAFSIHLFSSLYEIARTLVPIGMIPIPFFRTNSGTYHVGGSLPMTKSPKKFSETDMLGRPQNIKNVHFVDSSIFPDLPATTIGILSMANAHRIVIESFDNCKSYEY